MSRKGCAYETDLAMRGLFQVLKWGKWDLNILGNNTNGKHKKNHFDHCPALETILRVLPVGNFQNYFE